MKKKDEWAGGGVGKIICTYHNGWAKSHAFHHDMEFVALLDGVLVRLDLDGFDESLRPLGELWEIEKLGPCVGKHMSSVA